MKEGAGFLVKDPDLEAEGSAETLSGEAQRTLGTARLEVG